MTWVDVAMWAGLALLCGFTAGFKSGLSLGGDGMDYHRGLMAGFNLKNPPEPKEEG